MLRLFPISVLVLVLILLRLTCLRASMSSAAAGAAPQPRQAVDPPPGVPEPARISAERKRQLDELVREAIDAPTVEGRSAAAFAAADTSTDGLARTLAAIDAAQNVVVDNLRNADTIAFKATRCTCQADKPVYLLDLSQRSMTSTDRPLDLAIQGDGFFAVRIPDKAGVGYTRCGNLFVNNKDELVIGVGEGHRLVPTITIPIGITSINVGQDGTIQVKSPGQGAARTIGQLQLTRFTDPTALKRSEYAILLPTREAGEPMTSSPGENGAGVIQPGFLESSNVEPDRERLRLEFLRNWHVAIERAITGQVK